MNFGSLGRSQQPQQQPPPPPPVLPIPAPQFSAQPATGVAVSPSGITVPLPPPRTDLSRQQQYTAMQQQQQQPVYVTDGTGVPVEQGQQATMGVGGGVGVGVGQVPPMPAPQPVAAQQQAMPPAQQQQMAQQVPGVPTTTAVAPPPLPAIAPLPHLPGSSGPLPTTEPAALSRSTSTSSQSTQTPHPKKLIGVPPKLLADGSVDTLREKLVAALKDGTGTDVEFVVGPGKEKVKAHSLILRLLSPNLAAMLPPPPLKPPVQIPLPELDPTAVRAFLVHLYSSDPADLVEGLDPGTWKPAVDRLQAVLKLGGVTPDGDRVLKDELESRLKEVLDATIGPPDDPASSLPTIQEDDEFDAEADEPSSKPAQPAKPPSEFSKALAALRSLDPPQGMLAAPLLLSALSQRPPLTAGQLSRITAGLDFDVARQGTALEWPGGEIQKFHWVKGWIESNGVARRSAECKELGGYVRLEKIGLDDLEGVVEPSGIIPLKAIVRQYTIMARRLRTASGVPQSRSAQIAQQQQQQQPQQQQAFAQSVQPAATIAAPTVPAPTVSAAQAAQAAEIARQEAAKQEAARALKEKEEEQARAARQLAELQAQKEALERRERELAASRAASAQALPTVSQLATPAQSREVLPAAAVGATAYAAMATQAASQPAPVSVQPVFPPPQGGGIKVAQVPQQPAPIPQPLQQQAPPLQMPQVELPQVPVQQQAPLPVQVQQQVAPAPVPVPVQQQAPPPVVQQQQVPVAAVAPVAAAAAIAAAQPQPPPPIQPAPIQQQPAPAVQTNGSSIGAPPSANVMGVPPSSPQASGFDSWVAIPDDIAVQQDVILFRNPEVASTCRMKNPLTSGKWRWVLLVEKTATITPPPTSPGLSSKPPNIPSPLYFPDIGLVIGDADRFDPSQPLRSQLSTVSWDGRELVNVNAKPIPYNRAKGGYFKEGDIVVLDLNLDGPQTSLGFRKNGVDCGTAVRGFPAKVYLAMCAKAPVQIRWLALAQM